MCFRPPAAAKPIDCPGCGKKVPVAGNIKPKKCPHCGADLINAGSDGNEKKES